MAFDYLNFIYFLIDKFLYYFNYIILYIILIYLVKKKIVNKFVEYYNSLFNLDQDRNLILFNENLLYNEMKQQQEEKLILYNYYKEKLLLYINKKEKIFENKHNTENTYEVYKYNIENKILISKKNSYEKKILHDICHDYFKDKTDIQFLQFFYSNMKDLS